MRLGLGLVVLVVLVAGCGTESPRTPVEASGGEATVPPDPAAEVDFEHAGTTTHRLNVTVEVTLEGDVAVTERQPVNATIPVATYRRSTESGPSVVAVASSPLVQVVEDPPESRDPLSTLPTAELVSFVQSTYEEPEALSEAGTRQVDLLGEEDELTTYHGTADRDGDSVDVAVHVVRTNHEGDVVTVVAVHPLNADERDRLDELLAAIRH